MIWKQNALTHPIHSDTFLCTSRRQPNNKRATCIAKLVYNYFVLLRRFIVSVRCEIQFHALRSCCFLYSYLLEPTKPFSMECHFFSHCAPSDKFPSWHSFNWSFLGGFVCQTSTKHCLANKCKKLFILPCTHYPNRLPFSFSHTVRFLIENGTHTNIRGQFLCRLSFVVNSFAF